MLERNTFSREMADLESGDHTWPRVMFEFDVHYGFLSDLDTKLGQSPFGYLTTHDKKTDFFDVKRDLNRLEIGTAHFKLSAKGLAHIEKAKSNIAAFAKKLEKGCRDAKPSKITIPPIEGHPRLFPLPDANADNAKVLVHKLPTSEKKGGRFPKDADECGAWASPQAHLTIPLAKVGALIDEIKKSIGRGAGRQLTGAAPQRMGLRSDHLFKAKAGVESLRGAMITWKHKLKSGTLVDDATFTPQLAGFLMLQASYLWMVKLADSRDYEFYGKGHLPINVKTPFPEIYKEILTDVERAIYEELLAGPAIRYRMFGLVEDSPTLALGSNKLFPPAASDSLTWDDLLDWTLGTKTLYGLPGGGHPWPASEVKPRVALELRRIGHAPLGAGKWGTLIDTVVALAKKLNDLT